MNGAAFSFGAGFGFPSQIPKWNHNEPPPPPVTVAGFGMPQPRVRNQKVTFSFSKPTAGKPEHEQDVSVSLSFSCLDKDKAAEHSLHNQYDKKIRPCIDLVDSLRMAGIENDLMLPAIAVIGDQNSGKSSVLEALSGVAFPRGNGINTCCPLELKLKKITPSEEWKGAIYYRNLEIQLQNASEVKKAIREAQDVVAGTSGKTSGELISLQIWSPDVPDLTLIDLPKIPRVSMENQPQDNGQQIKMLLKKYIGCKETIILVVVPCNVDIAATEALKMAQEVDPTGERTLGLLTKPDLVVKGTEGTVLKIMRNEVIPLRKGYMIVKCHGQMDFCNKLSLGFAIQHEREFFETHQHFRILLGENKATIPHLANKLTNELVGHIIKTLPAIENQIYDALQQAKKELEKYTHGTQETDHEKMLLLAGLIKAFNEDISQAVYGRESQFGNEIRLLPKIRREFRTWGVQTLENSAKVQEIMHRKVSRYEDLYRGQEFPGFISYWTFEDIIKEQIAKLEEPAVVMLNKVICMVEEKFLQLANKHFANFPNLNKAAQDRIGSIRERQATTAKNYILTQFKMERIVYCQDNIYADDLKAARAESITKDTKTGDAGFGFASSQGPSFALEMVSHTKAYFTEASKRLSNQIPLIILSTVLHDFGDYLQVSMLHFLQGKEDLNNLLEEDQEAANHRTLLTSQVSRLNKAYQYLVDFKSL